MNINNYKMKINKDAINHIFIRKQENSVEVFLNIKIVKITKL